MKHFNFFVLFFLMGAVVANAGELPREYAGISFGMTEDKVATVKGLEKADGTYHFAYSEHFESDPHVYILQESENRNAEYYLFDNKVYKIFVTYKDSKDIFGKLVSETKTKYGEPDKTYDEEIFGMSIKHSVWYDEHTILDLREGAGFVFKVLIDKEGKREKQRREKMEEGI